MSHDDDNDDYIEDDEEQNGPPDEEDYNDDPDYAYRIAFADPGGRSSLHAASKRNPRIYPCPNCERENTLTAADVALGYQCDACADEVERGGPF